MASGEAETVMLAVLFADKLLEEDELVIWVTVMVEEPAVVNPVAVKRPVPA
jgi:hypothetical protein